MNTFLHSFMNDFTDFTDDNLNNNLNKTQVKKHINIPKTFAEEKDPKNKMANLIMELQELRKEMLLNLDNKEIVKK